jgi:hypothetical protein
MTSSKTAKQHHQLRSDVRYRLVHGEAVILRQEDGEVIVLNEMGTAMIQHLDQGETVEQMIEGLEKVYDNGGDKLVQDALAFVAELRSAGVVEESQARDLPTGLAKATPEETERLPYVPPEILMRQGLEAIAATCIGPVGFAKSDPIACPMGPINS